MANAFELELTGYAYGGEAIGRAPDGRMIFVPYSIPGERVRVTPVEDHKQWARAHLIEILAPSEQRVIPRCKHFGVCGGCHYQHLAYPAQVQAKADIVRAQLERLGKFQDPPVAAPIASPSPWNTRNHLQFLLNDEGRLSFVAARQPAEGSDPGSPGDRLIAVEECHLAAPPLDELWRRIEVEPIPGLERVSVRLGGGEERMVILHAGSPPQVELSLEVPASVIWAGPQEVLVLAGEGYLSVEVLDRSFRVSALSFFQVHTSLSQELVRLVLRSLDVGPGDVVYDLYAGVGLFSAFIAQAGAHVVAVEESPWACADFEVNLDEFDRVDLYESTVEAALPSIALEPKVVLVDPPRGGLGREVVQGLLQHQPSRLVYVSCDPATLARDGRLLADGGYRVERVTPIDLFPQTYHIECVSVWSR